MATQTLGNGGLTVENRTWYEKVLLGRNDPDWLHERFALKKSIPARGGKTISLRRFTRPAAATTALTEGTPPSATNATVAEITASLSQYGAYMLGSDVVETQTIDPQITEWTEVFGDMMRDTRDKVIRDSINAGTNVAYSGTATVRSGVASGSAFHLKWADIRNARKVLKKANAPYLADDRYVAILHPEQTKSLFSDSDVINAFKDAGNRGSDNPLFTGALGDLQGIRFFESSNATTFSGLGQSAGHVYAALFCGKDAYATVEYSAQTTGIIFQGKGSGGATGDPLEQVWSLGFKTNVVGKIVDDDRILRVESGPAETAP